LALFDFIVSGDNIGGVATSKSISEGDSGGSSLSLSSSSIFTVSI